MKNPFFSVIIPTYNRKDFLKIAISSVFYQTFPNFELIIVDDGSSDNTHKLMHFFKDKRLIYLKETHHGVSWARNQGLKRAKGEFICFLDSDDRFRMHKLEITYEYIKKYPQYKIFHTEEIWYRNGKMLAQKSYHKKPGGFVFEKAIKLCCISISTVAIKKEIFKDVGLFDENLPVCEDYDFWLRVTAKWPVFLIPHCLTIKEGGHMDQQSKKYPALDRFRIYALKRILEEGNLDQEKYRIALKELKNKCQIYIQGAKKRKKYQEVKYYESIILELEKKERLW